MTLLYFIFVLGVTIFIHELGHFIFAKKAGIYVYEFSLGMGPRILSFKKKETVYALRLFPIGGFVQMAGEEIEEDENIPKEMRMQSKTWLQRFLTVIAGVVFNFLLAILLLFIIGLVNGAPTNTPYLTKIYKEYPAHESGLKEGDQITHFNGEKIRSSDMLLLDMQVSSEKSISLTVKHEDGKTETIKIKPKKEVDGDKISYKYGFSVGNQIERGIGPSIKYAFTKTGSLLNQMVHIIGYLCTGKLGLDNLAGPIGIYSIVGESARAGFINIVFLIAYLCVNVGFINLLPIPAFDGGRILFMIIEKIKGSPVSAKTENIIHSIGMIFLMILMVVITCYDIMRLFG